MQIRANVLVWLLCLSTVGALSAMECGDGIEWGLSDYDIQVYFYNKYKYTGEYNPGFIISCNVSDTVEDAISKIRTKFKISPEMRVILLVDNRILTASEKIVVNYMQMSRQITCLVGL